MGVSVFMNCGLRGIVNDLIYTLTAVLPSFIVVVLVTVFFTHFRSGRIVVHVFGKVQPTIITLVLFPYVSTIETLGLGCVRLVTPLVTAILV